jgi:hypothetical protein
LQEALENNELNKEDAYSLLIEANNQIQAIEALDISSINLNNGEVNNYQEEIFRSSEDGIKPKPSANKKFNKVREDLSDVHDRLKNNFDLQEC